MLLFHRSSWGVVLVWVAVSAQNANSADWLRFRGPNGSGTLSDSPPGPLTWTPDKIAWRTELPGPGSSSPILVGDRVFVTCWSGYGLDRNEPGDQENLKRHLVCLDRNTGDVLWDKTVDAHLPEDRYGGMFAEHGYASHTPTSDGKHVYAFFGKSGVVKFDMNGNQLWQKNVGHESGAMNWGTASSPLLHENLVIVPATAESEALVALDKESGEEVWRQEASGFSSVWGSPILVPADEERTDLVIAVPNEIWGFNPKNGDLLWYAQGVSARSFCSSAIAHDGVVYAMESGPGGGGGIAMRAGGSGDVTDTHVIWKGAQQNRIGTPIYHDGRIYTFRSGVAACFDATTGDRIYQARLRGGRSGGGRRQDYASPVLAGDILYHTARDGTIFVVQAGKEFLQLGVNRMTEGEEDFSATPAVSDARLYVRSDQALYCVGGDDQSTGNLDEVIASAKKAAEQAPAEQGEDEEQRGSGRGFGGRGGGFDPAAYFRRQDTNGDGKLTGNEISDRLRDALDQIDTDGDEAVTEQEYLAGMRQLFRRGGRGGRGGGRGFGGGDADQAKPDRPQRPPLAS